MLSSQPKPVSAADPLQSQSGLLRTLAALAVLFGVLIRLSEYLHRRSLWEDEVNLALNIINRSYLELLQPLDHNQAAPPLFLWIEKAAVQGLGNQEYALRLLPLVSGLVALVGFYYLAVRYTTRIAAPIAVLLFACLKYILYYSNEVKQYSSDLMVAVVLCLLLIPQRQMLSRRQLLGLGLLGAVFIWLSHPTIFVLAGIEASHFLLATNPQRRRILTNRWPMYLLWLLSFAGLYALTIQNTLENDTLTDSWGERYPRSLIDWVWLVDAFGRFFYNPLGFLGAADGIAIVACLIGLVAYFYRDRRLLLIVTSPILITLIAAFLKQYPFRERLVLFLTPLFILIIAEGISFLLSQTGRWRKPGLVLGLFLLSALTIPPVWRAGQLIGQPTQIEELRPVLTSVKAQQQPTDQLYVYRSGLNQFLYYAPLLGYAPEQYQLGETRLAEGEGKQAEVSQQNIRQFRREIRPLRGSRVWFVFCRASAAEEQAFLTTVGSIGEQLDQFHQPGAMAYLYRLKAADR